MVGMVWFSRDLGISGRELMILAFVVTIGTGLLMVSNIPYYSFKEVGSGRRIPFVALVAVVLLFVFTSIDPPKVIFSGFALYALSGPAWWIWRRARRLARRGPPRAASAGESGKTRSRPEESGEDEEPRR